MKIAIVTDKSRKDFLPSEEAIQEDNQKKETVAELKRILSKEYECIDLVADDDIISTLKTEKVDLVFNLCNGLVGDSKLAQLPAMLEFGDIPYTASSVLGHTLASNKYYSSKIFESSKIATPKFALVNSVDELDNLDLSFPIIVKPNDEGSSRGIHQDSLVFNLDELKSKVEKSLETYLPPILLNEYIQGREFSVGVIGNGDEARVLAIQEVDLSNIPDNLEKFYSFEIKTYYKDKVVFHIPGRLTDEETKLIEDAVIAAYKSISLKDYARVDVILKDNIPYVLEINSLPGLQKGKSALYRISEAIGLGYDNLILEIVKTAIKRHNL